jgi:hypothetical protein
MILNFTVANDNHIDGPHEFMPFHDLMDHVKNSRYPFLALGDNIDIKNGKLKDKAVTLAKLHEFRAAVKSKLHNVYVNGNHELDATPDELASFNIGPVHVCHGHIPFWGFARAMAWVTEKKHGAGWFKRNILVRPLSAFRHLIPIKLNDECMAYLDDIFARYPQIKVVFMGHKHPPENMYFTYKGRTIIVLKRGVQEIGVEV